MLGPTANPVIPGSGRLRKLRWCAENGHRGKSGALRVCYVYFQEYHLVLMVMAYEKNEMEDIAKDDLKAIKKVIEHVEKLLEKKSKP